MLFRSEGGERFAKAWNFGPDADDDATVNEVAQRIATLWGSSAQVEHAAEPRWHEAGLLRLDSSQARSELGWRPRWSLHEALEHTVAWQQAWQRGEDMQAVCRQQIAIYAGAIQ